MSHAEAHIRHSPDTAGEIIQLGLWNKGLGNTPELAE